MPTRSRASHPGGGRAPRASKTSWTLIAAGVALIILAALMYAAVEAYRPAQAAPVEGQLEEVAPPAPQPTAPPTAGQTRPSPADEPRGETAPQPRRRQRPAPRPNRRRPLQVAAPSPTAPQPPEVAELPTEKPTTGRIYISTNPGGYPLSIDGRPAGETTDYARVTDLEAGEHTVKIIFPNDTPWERKFQVVAGCRYNFALSYKLTTINAATDTPETAPAEDDSLPPEAAGTPSPVSDPSRPPSVHLVSDAQTVTLCPGSESAAGPRVRLKTIASVPEGLPVRYTWTATAGRIEDDGAGAVWDLTGAAPGVYTAQVEVESGAPGEYGSCRAFTSTPVWVKACPQTSTPVGGDLETEDAGHVEGTLCDSGELSAPGGALPMPTPLLSPTSSELAGMPPPRSTPPRTRLVPDAAQPTPAATPAAAAPAAPPAKEQDRIVARHPQRLLEDKDSTLSVELSRVLGDVIAHTAKEGENLVTVGRPGEIEGAADPEATISEAFGARYKAFATVSLISDHLSIIEAPPAEQPLAPDKVTWEWRVRPKEGIGEKARFAFQIDVVWKADGLPDIRRSAVWREDCEAPVGLPAHMAALNYGSPASGLGGGGAMVGGFIQRRRRKVSGEEGDEEEDDEGAGVAVAAEPAADDVRCTAFAPEQVAPGDVFQVQVFAHLAEQAGGLAALAALADDAARDRGSAALSRPVERGAELTFRLQAPGLEVLEPEQTLVWQGRAEAPPCVQFAVVVPEDCKPKQTVGVVKIYYEKAPVGQLMFKLRVAEAGAPQPAPAPVAQREVRYRKAFISYCSKDRDKVARGLQGLKRGMKWAGIDYFMDMQDIESGEHWREVIQKNLDESDLFILFWSSAAKSSEEVYKEIRYALARKGGSEENPPYFEPITIELPLPAPPPELNALHFNDELLYIITAEESLRQG